MVKKVAVITALRGAALQDFLNVMRRRAQWYHIVIIPSIVQGDDCAPSVIRALEKAEEIEPDVIVVTRGGGSMEDLWGFNDENLVRRVWDSKIPIISAIGHQVDFSLLDFVADQRCETPSTAAEFITHGHIELANRLTHGLKDLKSLFLRFKSRVMQKIDKVNPLKVLHKVKQNIHHQNMRLQRLNLGQKVDAIGVHEKYMEIDDYLNRMQSHLQRKLERTDHKLSLLNSSLKGLNPDNVLGRGYSYLQTEKGKVISSLEEFDKVDKDTILMTRFVDGKGRVLKVD
jgi:exodeoxyribonuclease VII large subunit